MATDTDREEEMREEPPQAVYVRDLVRIDIVMSALQITQRK